MTFHVFSFHSSFTASAHYLMIIYIHRPLFQAATLLILEINFQYNRSILRPTTLIFLPPPKSMLLAHCGDDSDTEGFGTPDCDIPVQLTVLLLTILLLGFRCIRTAGWSWR